MTADIDPFGSCPIPISDYPSVLLAHGGGGSLSQMLIEEMFQPSFGTMTVGEPSMEQE